MEEQLDEENFEQEIVVKRKRFNFRLLLVIVVLVVFSISAYITNRAEFLKIREIDTKYTSIFMKNFYMKVGMFAVVAIVTYIVFYINNRIIRRGLKAFFDEENKTIPKLPNKSIAFISAIIAGITSLKFLYNKYIVCVNAASFVMKDPVFNMDIGFYMFVLPFIKAALIYLIVETLIMVIYTAIYYVIAVNVNFEKGINMETLKKNIFVKLIKFWAIIFTILICIYLVVAAQDILTGDMLTVKGKNATVLTGAGTADTFIKLWGYRLLSIVVFISVINIIRNANSEKFRKAIAAASVIPLYLIIMFGILIYFQEIYVGSSELDKEKEFLKYNIEATKEAYGIDISTKNITNYNALTTELAEENEDVIQNIPIFNNEVISKTIVDTKEDSIFYDYDYSNLGVYYKNGEKYLIYLTPREIIDDAARSYNNKTFEYTHGYGAVITDPNKVDKNGYITMIQSGFTEKNTDIVNISEPRIYYGLETDSEIIVNSKFGAEFDYPISATNYEEYDYDGAGGQHLNLLDRFVLGVNTGNYRIVLSKYWDEDSKIITTRNILERVKILLPYIEYDENPYLVVDGDGSLVWVIDGYTTSNNYPYSQITTIVRENGLKDKINYIRNSVKVLVNSYTGETKFYITDRNDPIIMMYRNMYPDLFMDLEEKIPDGIAQNLLYPQYLFEIQSRVLKTYHDITEDSLYRADDVWAAITDGEEEIKSKYTMLNTIGLNDSKLGLVKAYTKEGKESLIAYSIGYYDGVTPKLGLYRFSADSSIIGISQLNSLIEEDETISSELESLNVSGVKMVKDVIIVPIGNTILYVEPVYQVRANELEAQILKKIIVSSGNKVAIGDNLDVAIENLLSDKNSVRLEYVDMEDIDQVIDSVIEANRNLKDSIKSGDLEMIGKDLTALENLLDQLENLRKQEIKENGENRNESTK